VFDQMLDREVQPGLSGTRDGLDAGDRVTTEFEEIVVDTYLVHSKDLGPDIG
jgi:hypothetical protein